MPPTPGDAVADEPQAPRFAVGYTAGTVIAERYRLEEPIGFGGMGTVWRAHNQLLDVSVAVKLLRPTVHQSGSAERLLLEAKAAACLRHPAIVRVFDFGLTEEGDPFLAMELLQGESLRDLLERDRVLAAPQAIRLLLPVLEGLSCAHSRGIVHRDLKPDNIFMARDDAGRVEPKVVDFGIAKFEGSSSRLTTAGVLLGSPSYMSPEQSMGEEDIDARADIWSIAVVLYEIIAGKTPWEAPNCPALLRAIVDDPPPSLLGFGGVDAELWAVIERALSKRREDRWASSRAMGQALAAWLFQRGIVDDLSGTSLRTSWLADAASSGVRGSLASIPPVSASPTVESMERAAGQLTTTAPPPSPLVGPSKKRRWLTLGIGLPVAASLMLFQMGFGTSPSHEGAASIAQPTPLGDLASLPPPESEGAIDPSPAAIASQTGARAHVPSAERSSRFHDAPGGSARMPLSKLPVARRGSARAMDFGF